MTRAKLLQILAVVGAVVVGAISVVDALDGAVDAPWLPVLMGVLYASRRLVQQLEPFVGVDLDGDGYKGPRAQSPPWVGLLAALGAYAALMLAGSLPVIGVHLVVAVAVGVVVSLLASAFRTGPALTDPPHPEPEPAPIVGETHRDVVMSRMETRFSLRDRLRLILHGRAFVDIDTYVIAVADEEGVRTFNRHTRVTVPRLFPRRVALQATSRSPWPITLVAVVVALLVSACGGGQSPIGFTDLTLTGDVCAGGDLVWSADGPPQGEWAAGGTGVVAVEVDTPVGPASVELRTYGEGAEGYVGGAIEVCAEWATIKECRVIVEGASEAPRHTGPTKGYE